MSRPTRTLPAASIEAMTRPGAEEPLANVAYCKIKSAILEGALPPGLFASEQQIAAKLEMSRTPVHQAIVRLEQEGWMALVPRRGVMVAPISAKEMHDIYEALLALEVAAVARLATRDAAEVKKAIAALEDACNAADTSLDKGDLSGWAAADGHFHALLVEESGNAHLWRLAKSVMEHVQRARLLTLKLRPRPTASNGDHRAILAAIKAGDRDGACERMARHRRRGMDTLLPILEALSTESNFFLTS